MICNDVNDPILLGIVPTNDRLSNEIDMTLSYVADPLTVPHVTPWYEHHAGAPVDKLRCTLFTSFDVPTALLISSLILSIRYRRPVQVAAVVLHATRRRLISYLQSNNDSARYQLDHVKLCQNKTKQNKYQIN